MNNPNNIGNKTRKNDETKERLDFLFTKLTIGYF